MANILIISIENAEIKTEEIYFTNKKNKGKLSFKNDIQLRKQLGIHDIFFISFDFLFSKQKVKKTLDKLKIIDPQISECYIICDKDNTKIGQTKAKKTIKIKEQVDKISKLITDILNINIKNIIFLEYEKDGMNFEDFLCLHSEKNKLFEGYKKTNPDIYKKTMGANGKNLQILLNNISKKQKCMKFKLLFKERKLDENLLDKNLLDKNLFIKTKNKKSNDK